MIRLLGTGGTVVDGIGVPGRTADLAIINGKVCAVGQIDKPATETIDADGALVTTG